MAYGGSTAGTSGSAGTQMWMWSTLSRRLVVDAEADGLRADRVRRGVRIASRGQISKRRVSVKSSWLNQTNIGAQPNLIAAIATVAPNPAGTTNMLSAELRPVRANGMFPAHLGSRSRCDTYRSGAVACSFP